MKTLKKIILLTAVFALCFSLTSTFAQEINVTGVVVNSNQAPVSNVFISLQKNPDIFCYSNAVGEFSLVYTVSSLAQEPEEVADIKQNRDGSLEIKANNRQFRMEIVDLLGKTLSTFEPNEKLNGTYIIYPGAYIQNLPLGFYITRITLGNYQRGFKIYNDNRTVFTKGLGLISYGPENLKPKYKKSINNEDSLIFAHDFYKTTKILISDLTMDVGTVELENFGDYSPSEGVYPDQITYNKKYGNFVKVMTQDSSQFILNIDPYATSEKEIKIKAIPVQNFGFIDPSFKFIAGIHLEPSGTHFYIPVQVNIEFNRVNNTDSLVVMLHNNETGKICYIPFLMYNVLSLEKKNVGFLITHFSDIVIGKGEIPDQSGTTFIDSDDASSYIASLIALGVEIPDELFKQWYNDILKYEIASIIDMETLKFAVSEFFLMNQYAIYANKSFEALEFYNEAIAGVNEKINYLFDLLKQQCSTLNDPCLKKDLALIAVQINIIAQLIEGINEVPLDELCNGTALDLVHRIVILQPAYLLKPGETTQIQFQVENIYNEIITASLEWYSDDPGIVQVDNEGNLTAVKQGVTKVHTKSCDIENSVQVNITNDFQNPCYSLPRPVIGTYNTRILLSGYYKNQTSLSVLAVKRSLDITLVFKEDGWDNIYYGKNYEAWTTVHTHYESGKYRIKFVEYNHYTKNVSLYQTGDIYCHSASSYYLDDPHGADFIYIYPDSRTVKAKGNHLGSPTPQIITGFGTF